MLPQITRDPDTASRAGFDLIVVGGGIYGVMMLFEATRRKIRALLVEREDFGSGTSFNWLRIIHGGLRYLQDADLPRFFESVAERSWFLKTFPSLVHPVPCLMPLYGKGLRRPSILRMAVLINDLLSLHRNQGIQEEKQIARGRILSRGETLKLAPGIRAEGLKGGVVWHDALLPESPILIKEILRWCVGQGAMALNYTAARSLTLQAGRVSGVEAEDLHLRKVFEFRSPTVVNAAGPWCRQVAAALDRDHPELFAHSKAWNVLFDRPAPAASVLAVAPHGPGARTYFLLPWKGRLLAGTGHAPCESPGRRGRPTAQELHDFISDINKAVPGLGLHEADAKRVFCGLLPAVRQGSDDLADRSVIVDHGRQGGPRGLFSVSGVKFTTARRVAEKTMHRLFPGVAASVPFNSTTLDEAALISLKRSVLPLNGEGSGFGFDIPLENLEDIVRSESVVNLQDLVFRRTNLWEHPGKALEASALVGRMFGLDRDQIAAEVTLMKRLLENDKTI
jgi:glycerol-3-phosphate dehydrogenase